MLEHGALPRGFVSSLSCDETDNPDKLCMYSLVHFSATSGFAHPKAGDNQRCPNIYIYNDKQSFDKWVAGKDTASSINMLFQTHFFHVKFALKKQIAGQSLQSGCFSF